VFGFYLIYDTQLIVGGKRYELDYDDYIIGALMIYIDIIALFVELLQILLSIFGNNN
jgi:FtsH-binding integral membrane protein